MTASNTRGQDAYANHSRKVDLAAQQRSNRADDVRSGVLRSQPPKRKI